MNSAAEKGRRKAISRGLKNGILAGMTGRIPRRGTITLQVLTSDELQAMAWNKTGDAIRRAMRTQR